MIRNIGKLKARQTLNGETILAILSSLEHAGEIDCCLCIRFIEQEREGSICQGILFCRILGLEPRVVEPLSVDKEGDFFALLSIFDNGLDGSTRCLIILHWQRRKKSARCFRRDPASSMVTVVAIGAPTAPFGW